MSGLFSPDGFLGRSLSRFADFIVLSILWIVFSLPIVTLGASTTALYTMTLRMVRDEEGKIAAGFLRAFKENFKSATWIHLILLLLAGLVGNYWMLVGLLPEKFLVFFRGVSILFWVLWLMETLFVYPVQARFENTVWNTMKNAWLMAAGNLHIFLLAVLITGIPFWTFLLNTALFIGIFPAWLLVAPGLLAWLNSFLFHHCFKKYIAEEA